jgi:hypothetical protein
MEDVLSYNVIGEIKGRASGKYHGRGRILILGIWLMVLMMTAGVVQSMEVLNIFKNLGYKPKKYDSSSSFMNEENGLRGGKKIRGVILVE